MFQNFDSPKSKLILQMCTKSLGPERSVQFSEGQLRHVKIREREGPSQGVVQHSYPHDRSPCAPTFDDRSEEQTLTQERCDSRVAWKIVYVHDLGLRVTVQILEDTPAVLSLGKLCEDHRYSFEWTSDQKTTPS